MKARRNGGIVTCVTACVAGILVAACGAGPGQDAMTGLEAGMIVISLVMAAGCALGLNRRLAEYR